MCSTPAWAVYKWTDKNNVTHYGQFPPKGHKAKELITETQTPLKKPAKGPLAQEPTNKNKATNKESKTTTEPGKTTQEENCTKARHNLQILVNNRRIRIEDNGSYRVLPEEERLQQIDALNEQIGTLCQSNSAQRNSEQQPE
jgi:hypothetical protein